MTLLYRIMALFMALSPFLPALYIEAEDPRVEARPAAWSNRRWVWAMPQSNDLTRKALSGRPEGRNGTLVSSGYGFGNLSGGVGDAGFAGLPVKPVLRLPFSNAATVAVHFLFHEQGHTARAVLWQGTRIVTNMAIETWAPMTLSWNEVGVMGTARPVVVAQNLDPALAYVLDVSNTGSIPRAGQPGAKHFTDARAEKALGRGPQLLVDGFELFPTPMPSLHFTCLNGFGQPFSQARVLLRDGRGAVAGAGTSDGLGRFTFPSLPPAPYKLTVETWPGRKTEAPVDLTDGTNLNLALPMEPVLEIVRPRTAVAFIGDSVGTFTVELEAPEDATGFEARLCTRERTITLPLITRPVYSQGAVLGESRPGWLLQFPLRLIKPPADTWDLEVEATIQGVRLTRRSPRAVKILARADEPFSVFHVGDLRLTDGTNRLRAQALLATLGLTGCRLVVLGGDLGNRPGWFPDAQAVESFFQGPDHPALVTLPGELDVTPITNYFSNAMLSRQSWLRAVGPTFHELRWPGTYFLFHDSLADPLKYSLPAWHRSQRDSRDNVRVIFSHEEAWRPASNETPRPDLFLVTHGRTNRITPPPPYPVVTTPPVDGNGPLGARLLNFTQDVDLRWRLSAPVGSSEKRGTFVKLVTPDPKFPGGRPLLSRRVHGANDGTMASNQVEFRNETPVAFPEAPVRFILRRGSYQTFGPAELLSAYDTEDRNHTVICLRVRVAPGTVTRAGVSAL